MIYFTNAFGFLHKNLKKWFWIVLKLQLLNFSIVSPVKNAPIFRKKSTGFNLLVPLTKYLILLYLLCG